MKTVLKVVKWLLITFFVMSLPVCFGAVWIVELPIHLAVGWIYFLVRVLPEVTFRRSGIAEALGVVAVLGVGTHLFLRGLWRQLRAEEARANPWPVRWSVSLVALLMLLFGATMATVGIGHQVGWLMSDSEPMVQDSWRDMRVSYVARDLCERAVELADKGLSEGRVLQELLTSPETRADAEQMHVVRLQGPTEAPLFVVYSRDPVVREQTGGQRCGLKHDDRVPVTASQLPHLVKERRVAADTPP